MYAEYVNEINADERLRHAGRSVNAKVLLQGESFEELLVFSNGELQIISGQLVMPNSTFKIRMDEEAWNEYLSPTPIPGRNDIFALLRNNLATVEGDLQQFFANLQFFKDVLAVPIGRKAL